VEGITFQAKLLMFPKIKKIPAIVKTANIILFAIQPIWVSKNEKSPGIVFQNRGILASNIGSGGWI